MQFSKTETNFENLQVSKIETSATKTFSLRLHIVNVKTKKYFPNQLRFEEPRD